MIVREFSLDPAVFSDPEALREILTHCGIQKGRLLSGVPEKMQDELWRQIDGLGDVARQVAWEVLAMLQYRTHDCAGPWSRAVRDSDAQLAYHGFLSSSAFADRELERRRVDPAKPFSSPVFDTDSDEVDRDPESLAEAIRPLLQTGREIRIVDPYFRPSNRRFVSVLEEFARMARRTPFDRSPRARFEIHTALGIDDGDRSAFSSAASTERQALDRSLARCPDLGRPLVCVWKKESFHDRYVLTEKAGVRFSVGVDAGTSQRGQARTAINLLKQKQLSEYWRRFDSRRRDGGDFVGEIKPSA